MLGALRRSAPAISRLVSSSTPSRVVLCDVRPVVASASCCSQLLRTRTFHHSVRWQQYAQQVEQEEAQAESNYNAPNSGPITDFDQLATQGLVDPGIVRNITQGMGIKTMTEVQSRTINEALKGADM